MKRVLLEPLIFASGISLFLFAHNPKLSLGSYLAPLPFWIAIGRPLGLFWNKNVLKELNRDVFPPDMRNYRELYLVSKRALAYDIVFNHGIYNPLLSVLVLGYTCLARQLEEKYRGEGIKVSVGDALKKSGWGLIQIRGLVSLASIISEYWVSYFSLSRGV